MAGGFFSPESSDLLRVRKEFEMDATEIRQILAEKDFKSAFTWFNKDNAVKTAPKGFSKEDPNIDLLRLKNYFVVHNFTDAEVLSKDFQKNLVHHFKLSRPYFDYMSDLLTTDLNGVSLI